MKPQKARSLLTAALLFTFISFNAQPGDDLPPTDGGPGCCDTGPDGPDNGGGTDVPFDGGISVILAAGVGYGIKKAHDMRMKRKEL
jgi:hypothetical protein